MVQRWVQHLNGKVIRGVGAPPSDGDVFLIAQTAEETCAVVNDELRVNGKKVNGKHDVTLASGETVTFTADSNGKVKRNNKPQSK